MKITSLIIEVKSNLAIKNTLFIFRAVDKYNQPGFINLIDSPIKMSKSHKMTIGLEETKIISTKMQQPVQKKNILRILKIKSYLVQVSDVSKRHFEYKSSMTAVNVCIIFKDLRRQRTLH